MILHSAWLESSQFLRIRKPNICEICPILGKEALYWQVFKDVRDPKSRRITREQVHLAKQVDAVMYFRIQNGTLYDDAELDVFRPIRDMINEYAILLSTCLDYF